MLFIWVILFFLRRARSKTLSIRLITLTPNLRVGAVEFYLGQVGELLFNPWPKPSLPTSSLPLMCLNQCAINWTHPSEDFGRTPKKIKVASWRGTLVIHFVNPKSWGVWVLGLQRISTKIYWPKSLGGLFMAEIVCVLMLYAVNIR